MGRDRRGPPLDRPQPGDDGGDTRPRGDKAVQLAHLFGLSVETWIGKVRDDEVFREDEIAVIARAIVAGFAGDRVVFAHLAIPQIENSLRGVFRDAGLPITTMNAKGIQEERDLNTLLMDEGAKSVLGEALVWEMRSLLIERTGPNLRNRLWHGLLGADDFDRPAMNVLLWLIVFLLLRHAGYSTS